MSDWVRNERKRVRCDVVGRKGGREGGEGGKERGVSEERSDGRECPRLWGEVVGDGRDVMMR